MDYIACLGKYYPSVFATCIGDATIYENIIHDSGDPIPSKAELDAQIFKDIQSAAITALSITCETTIMAGFTSSALGSEYNYASTTLDQINLIGSVIASQVNAFAPQGTSVYYKCAPVVNGVVGTFGYQLHSPNQMLGVFMSGVMYKQQMLGHYQQKLTLVNAAKTQAEVSAITWTSQP
jgi:hypothetical protein